ncbi:MAG: ABC transporter permease [Deltaproteobacteria bacterium]|jgi:ABC-2 type transport system permease protein|nr:ABC transporter permease [Deltaproteobacteria bacterium]
MKAIIKKELRDHFGSVRFVMVLSLVFMVSFLLTHLAGQSIRDVLAQGGSAYLEGRTFLLLFTATGAFFSLTVFLSIFGPIVGLVMGFDAINRERNHGTLSKILAQPIHRDEVILGKYLAGLITLAVMLTSLMLLLSGMGLLGVGAVPTADEVLRLCLFWVLTMVYQGFWLGLAILLSIIFRSVATSAMTAAALWIFIVFFVPVLGESFATALSSVNETSRPAARELQTYNTLRDLSDRVSPAGLFTRASSVLLDPTHRGSDQTFKYAMMSVTDRYLATRFRGVLSLGQSLLLVMPDVILLLCFSALIFLLSYVIFVRQEVRSV